MDNEWSRVAARIETYGKDMVRFQSGLVACPALGPDNGGQGEAKKAELIKDWLNLLEPDELIEADAPDERVESGRRPNLTARFKGQGQGRVSVLSHIDIVPPGELSLWDSDPYVLRQDGDRLYGRGVEDNHHGLVASYFAVKALRDEGLTPAYDAALMFVADEETGSVYGLSHLLETKPELFSPKDLIIVPDAGHEDGTMIEIAEKSMLWLKFTVKGKQCHAGTPHRGVNTLRASARMITALDKALPQAFDAKDNLFSIPASTFEPTKKEANVPNVNTIPGEDVFFFDARVLPQYSLEAVKAKAEEVAVAVAAESGVSVKVETAFQVQAPLATPADAPVVKALARGVAEVHGRKAMPMGIGGGTVAAFFRAKGLPAAVWSTIPGNAHAPNEFTRLSYLIADAKVLAHVFLGL
ncbi:MAG: M20 family metallo-hydrolase [Thermodesulfobacteriota bacterium]|nr:M20 family metallo-hydrolase [Thermodesulfobacteriota bacterium]